MSTEPPKPGVRRRPAVASVRLEELAAQLETGLDDPESLLEALVTASAKGHDVKAQWNLLHSAAVRHEKVSELAFAYEHVLHEKRIKLLPAEQQAAVNLHAVRFFADAFGDPDGAIAYAERALAAAPSHPEAFAVLEELLTETGQPLRLAKIYLAAAQTERNRDTQIVMLGRAAELVEQEAGADDLAIEVYQRILRIDSGAIAARRALEQRLVAVGRTREGAKLLEQRLAQTPPPSDDEARSMRQRLIELYVGSLGDPKAALPHVEVILASDPGHELARQVAERLLENKALASRASVALSDAYEKLGRREEAAALLAQELKVGRGPRRMEVQRRLGILKQEVLGDPAGALELLAPVVAGDPGDDALRRRFVELSESLGQPLEAARLLARALGQARDAAVRARVLADVGRVQQRAGDMKAAQAAYAQVLETGHDDGAMLIAARALAEVYAEARASDALSRALELVVKLEPEREARQAAARRLARLCETELDDAAKAVVAYRALIGSPWTEESLRKLEEIYTQNGDAEGLLEVLEARADRVKDPAEARALALKVAEQRAQRARDPQAALAIWDALAARFGSTPEIDAKRVPLLERAGRWEDLAKLVELQVKHASTPAEQAILLGQLGEMRVDRLADTSGALEAFREALALDPNEAKSRGAVESLLASEAARSQAAAVLEPIYRRENNAAGLVRVLEVRALEEREAGRKLGLLGEAVSLVSRELKDASRALLLAGQALELSVREERASLPGWLKRVEGLAAEASDPTARAQALSLAIGQTPIDSAELATLGRAAGDALAACGEIPAAVEVYRRVLQFSPSAELVKRVDELLAQQGSPHERLSLYKTALEHEADRTRRRELLHAMAALQRRELGDPQGALETWRRVLAEDPKDQTAHQALLDACQAAGDWEGVYAELARTLEHQEGERRSVTLLRMAEVCAEHGQLGRALGHYRELMQSAELADDVLDSIEQLARSEDDHKTTHAVLERRLERARGPEQRAELYERLGNLQAWQLDDAQAAANAWLEGARLSEAGAVDEARARRLYERVLGASPDHEEAAERLFELAARAGDFASLSEPIEALLRSVPERAASLLLEVAEPAVQAGAGETIASLTEAALATNLPAALVRRLEIQKARALARTPGREDAAAAELRTVLEAGPEDALGLAETFDAFLRAAPPSPARIADRRWLFAWRAERTNDPASVLLSWASAEQNELGDTEAAARLYERVLELDPERTDALSELSKLRVAHGDAEGALRSLSALRDRMGPEMRIAIELEMAALLVDQLGRPLTALELVAPIVEAQPTLPEGLRLVRALLAHRETRNAACEILERAAEASEDDEARAQVLEALLAVSEGSTELAEARARWFKRLLESSGNDPEATLPVALRAAEECLVDGGLWELAERLSRKLERPEPIAEAYSRALGRALSPEAAEQLGRRVVEFTEEWFDDPGRVVTLLERVLELNPGASWAFDRLKLAFNAAGRWAELFALYDRALELMPAEARIELLREAAMAAKDFAAEPDRAIGYFEQLDALAPGDSRIDAALERLYERQGRKRPLITLLMRRLDSTKGRKKLELRSRIASFWLELAEVVPAFELVEAMLQEDPESLEAVTLLEQLIAMPAARDSVAPPPPEGTPPASTRSPGPSVVSVRDKAASYLKTRYEAAGRTVDVVRMLQIEAESAVTLDDRVARLRQIVGIRLEQLGDEPGALSVLSELVRIEPGSREHRGRFAEVAARIGAEAERAELLGEVGSATEDVGLRAELLREAADVQERKVGNIDQAIALWLQVLEAGDEAAGAALEAARRLDGLLARASRLAERRGVLERLAELEADAGARQRALGEAARVAMTLGDPERAIRAWRARLEDDPRDAEALDGLCASLEQAERWDELAVALDQRATLAGDPAAARRDRVALARLHAERRSDRDAAIDAWRRVREAYGPDDESSVALAELLESEDRFEELAQHLAGEAERAQDPARRAALYQKLGHVLGEGIKDPVRALNAFVWAGDWESAIAVVAGAGPEQGLSVCQSLLDVAVDAWTAAAEPQPGAERAAAWAIDELITRLREQGRHAELVTLLLRGASLPLPRKRRRELRREAACLTSDRLDDPKRAIEIFKQLFQEDAGDEAALSSVTRLALLLEEQELLTDLVALWEEQARARALMGDSAASAALWARAAEIAETRVEDIDRAIADHRQGAGLGGEGSLEALARLYESRGEHALAAEVLEWFTAGATRDVLAERALRLAQAYIAAGDRRRARQRLEEAAVQALDASGVRRRLAELYREASDWAALAELLAVEASRAPDAKSRLALLREASELHLERRNDPASAVPLLEQAIELDADEPALRLLLSDALRRAGRLDDAAAALRAQIERYGTRRPKERALVHFELARVALEAGKRAEALGELDVANKIDPAHPGILRQIARLAFQEDQFDRAEKMYRALLLVLGREQTTGGASRAEALLDLSEIAARRDDALRATEFVESAFEAALDAEGEAEALERALRERGRTELLARAVEARLKAAADAPSAARALADLVFLHSTVSDTPPPLRDRARSIERELEEQQSADETAWLALERVFEWFGDSAAHARVLERRVLAMGEVSGPEAAEPIYRLAELRLGSADTRERGLELLDRALVAHPDAERGARILRSSLGAEGRDERTVRLLERIARAAEDERGLAEALALRLRLPGGLEPAALREAVGLARRLEDSALADSMLSAAKNDDSLPGSDAAWVRNELAALRALAGNLPEALELREQAARFLGPEEARAVLLSVAREASETLSNHARAANIYEELRRREPAERELWEPLLQAYRRLGDTARLVGLIEQTIPLVDSAEDRARLRLDLATVLLEDPDKLEAAKAILREILDEDPTQRGAAMLLSGILENAGQNEELAELLSSQLNAAKDREDVESIVSMSLRLGALYEQQDRPRDALDAYRGVLDWDPHAKPALEAVLRLAEASSDGYLVADAIEGLLKVAEHDNAEELAWRLVELRREQADEQGIERALELGFNANPGSAQLCEALFERYQSRSDWHAAASALRRAVLALPGERDLVRRMLEAHRAAEESEAALEVVDALIARRPDDAWLYRERSSVYADLARADETLADLERAYALSREEPAELVEALEQAIARADPPEDMELTLRLIKVLEETGDLDGARARLAEVVKQSPKDVAVLWRLAALESRAEHWPQAANAYRQLVQLEQGERLVRAALELADVCERGGRLSEARYGLERALNVDRGSRELRQRLRAVYAAAGATRDLARLMLEDAAAETEVAARLPHLLAAGETLLAPDGDVLEAIRVLEQVRALAPDNIEGIVLLARANASADRTEPALTMLKELVTSHRGRRSKQLALAYQELSSIQLLAGRLSEALGALTKAFEMDVRNGRLAMQLGQLALDIDDDETAARAFRSVTMMRPTDGDPNEGATPDAKAEAHYQLARLAQKQGDSRKAKLLVTKALAENPQLEAARLLLLDLEAAERRA